MEPIIQFFAYAHLPPLLQDVSRPFAELAARIMDLPRNPERTVALRKLLESKDAAVRAKIYAQPVVDEYAVPNGVVQRETYTREEKV